jgi:acetyl esterase/lipase
MRENAWSVELATVVAVALFSVAYAADVPEGESAGKDEVLKVPAGVTVKNDIPYVPNGNSFQTLDLYLPESTGHPVPLVVFVHAGGWHVLDKRAAAKHPLFLLSHGYAVASINYRLVPDAIFPAQIEDCRSAIRFLRSQAATYGIAPDHIGIWGASAGGQLVALMGTSAAADFSTMPAKVADKVDPSIQVQCVIDWYGPADFTKVMGSKAVKVDNAAIHMLGAPASEDELMARAAWASPITYVRSDNPPFLIEHGDADPTVPVDQSRELVAALQKAGVEATLKEMPGSKHGGPAFSKPDNTKLILDFLDKHLKS